MSRKKTGHTTTKNTQKKRVKETNATFQQNTDQLKNEPVVGVMCVIDNKETITPIRFAFPKIHLSNFQLPIDMNLEVARQNVMGDIGQLYYAVTNYNEVKSTLGELTQANMFDKLVEAVGTFVTIVSQQEKDSIATNFKPYDSVGIIFGFTYTDKEKSGEYTIQETQTGFHFTDFESWMETTNNFKEEVSTTGTIGEKLSEGKIIIS